MDLNAAGLLRQDEGAVKLREASTWQASNAFDPTERAALAYAEAMTRSDTDVTDELFGDLRGRFTDEELVLLTSWICLENFYSKFNRSFRVEAQGFCVIPSR